MFTVQRQRTCIYPKSQQALLVAFVLPAWFLLLAVIVFTLSRSFPIFELIPETANWYNIYPFFSFIGHGSICANCNQ